MREVLQRLLRRGPRYGMARGVAVLAPDGSRRRRDTPLAEPPPPSPDFPVWARQHGVALDGSAQSLSALDAAIDAEADPAVRAGLGNDAGLYLGEVLVALVPGAGWLAWPNGHPVVRLASGRDVDVVALAGDRVAHGSPALPDVLADALL